VDRHADIGLVRRFLALLETRADELAPATYRQPAADYTSVEHLERERRTLFRGKTSGTTGTPNSLRRSCSG